MLKCNKAGIPPIIVTLDLDMLLLPRAILETEQIGFVFSHGCKGPFLNQTDWLWKHHGIIKAKPFAGYLGKYIYCL